MAFADQRGHARADPTNPRAQAVCDQCGIWYNWIDLREQVEWQGNALVKLGFLVCRTCYDEPQDQNRAFILPLPDPAPILEPRPDPAIPPLNQQGFTLFTLQPAIVPGDFADGQVVATAASIATAKATVLADIAALSGIAIPATAADLSGTLAKAITAQSLIGANAQRNWIAIYNPTDVPMIVSTGTAAFRARSGIPLGPGNVVFWATAQGLGTPWRGAMTVIGYVAGSPFWVWDSPAFGYPPIPVVGAGA